MRINIWCWLLHCQIHHKFTHSHIYKARCLKQFLFHAKTSSLPSSKSWSTLLHLFVPLCFFLKIHFISLFHSRSYLFTLNIHHLCNLFSFAVEELRKKGNTHGHARPCKIWREREKKRKREEKKKKQSPMETHLTLYRYDRFFCCIAKKWQLSLWD